MAAVRGQAPRTSWLLRSIRRPGRRVLIRLGLPTASTEARDHQVLQISFETVTCSDLPFKLLDRTRVKSLFCPTVAAYKVMMQVTSRTHQLELGHALGAG